MEFTRINPITGEVASSAQAMKAGDIPAIAARAAAAFPAWSAQGPNARRAVLMKAAAALEAKKDAFVAAMMAETGSTAGWAMFNLGLAAGMVREAAALTTQIAGEVIPSDKPGCLAMAVRQPGSGRSSQDADGLGGRQHDPDRGRIEPAGRKPDREKRQMPATGEEERRVGDCQPGCEGIVNDCGIESCH